MTIFKTQSSFHTTKSLFPISKLGVGEFISFSRSTGEEEIGGRVEYKINGKVAHTLECALPIEIEDIKKEFSKIFPDAIENTIVSYDIYSNKEGLICKHFFHI